MMVSTAKNHFLANVCHTCKTKDTLYTCTICRMVFYCSWEHRRKDWYEHSRLCWAINKICQAKNIGHLFESFDGLDYSDFRHDVARKCIELLGRGLKTWELEVIYHPRVCNVCREFNWEKLTPCEKCNFVYACEKLHFRKDHDKWCEILKLYSDIVVNETEIGSNKLEEFNNAVKTIKGKPKSMIDLLRKSFGAKYENRDVETALMSELLTYPLTVFNSLIAIQATNKQEITILFVGAETQAEVDPIDKWEKYLLHRLETVRKLNLIFLGPNLNQVDRSHLEDLCDSCRCQNKELRSEFVVGKFYHEYTPSKNVKIDLICAMNSGMYREFGFADKDSWNETIIELFERGSAPVLITEYTSHELKKDLKKLKNLCGQLKFVVPFNVNPFASLKPGLNIVSEDESPVMFKNYFHVVVEPKNGG